MERQGKVRAIVEVWTKLTKDFFAYISVFRSGKMEYATMKYTKTASMLLATFASDICFN